MYICADGLCKNPATHRVEYNSNGGLLGECDSDFCKQCAGLEFSDSLNAVSITPIDVEELDSLNDETQEWVNHRLV